MHRSTILTQESHCVGGNYYYFGNARKLYVYIWMPTNLPFSTICVFACISPKNLILPKLPFSVLLETDEIGPSSSPPGSSSYPIHT